LRRCSFREKWCSWIAHCISLVRFSVLVNGIFSSSCGLKYGLTTKVKALVTFALSPKMTSQFGASLELFIKFNFT
jgi:hypothetical protein